MDNGGIKRRGFIGASLVAAGAAIGALARKADPIKPVAARPDSRFAYDLSEFEKTDPAHLLFKPARQFETGFQTVRRIATQGEEIWVAGDRSIKVFHSEGKPIREIQLGYSPHAFQPGVAETFVASVDFFELLDASGKRIFRSQNKGGKAHFTAVQPHQNQVYIADAGNREVLICDRKSGETIARFGKFAIPSPYFDLQVAPDNRLRIANTGQLRIETFSLDGQFQSAWGEAGMKIDRFCGCCNPVYFAITPQGEFITSEKGLARINVYTAKGQFKGAVAGPETLVENKELARRACVDCRVGAGFDVAVDSEGRVFALDPYKKTVRCFTPV